jgi:hypothetical protein
MAGKLLWRAGGFTHPTATEIMTVDTTQLKGNITTFGTGIGVDTGLQYYREIKKKYILRAGLVMTDIGNTSFSSGAASQMSNLTFGVAGTLKSADMVATLAYDYSNILTLMDWRKRNHLGLELKFPILSLYGGLSQFSPTYGAGIDIGLVKVMYCSYVEELDSIVGQNSERSHLINFTAKF